MSVLLNPAAIDTATVAVSKPFRISDTGSIHVTVSIPGYGSEGAWVDHRAGPDGWWLIFDGVEARLEGPLTVSDVEGVIYRHGLALAHAIESDAELAQHRADVARWIAEEEP
jgi:hypothetical protein